MPPCRDDAPSPCCAAPRAGTAARRLGPPVVGSSPGRAARCRRGAERTGPNLLPGPVARAAAWALSHKPGWTQSSRSRRCKARSRANGRAGPRGHSAAAVASGGSRGESREGRFRVLALARTGHGKCFAPAPGGRALVDSLSPPQPVSNGTGRLPRRPRDGCFGSSVAAGEVVLQRNVGRKRMLNIRG